MCGGRRCVVCSRGSGISCTQPTLACCLIAPRRLLRRREKSGRLVLTQRARPRRRVNPFVPMTAIAAATGQRSQCMKELEAVGKKSR